MIVFKMLKVDVCMSSPPTYLLYLLTGRGTSHFGGGRGGEGGTENRRG